MKKTSKVVWLGWGKKTKEFKKQLSGEQVCQKTTQKGANRTSLATKRRKKYGVYEEMLCACVICV